MSPAPFSYSAARAAAEIDQKRRMSPFFLLLGGILHRLRRWGNTGKSDAGEGRYVEVSSQATTPPQNFLTRGIVSGLVKQREPSDTTVQDMIREVSSSKAWTARHGRSSTKTVVILSRKDSRPLFCVVPLPLKK
jgi:hypothetical protein